LSKRQNRGGHGKIGVGAAKPGWPKEAVLKVEFRAKK
jgi:hypothetical protein